MRSIHTLAGLKSVTDVCIAANVTRYIYDRAMRNQLILEPAHRTPEGRRCYYTSDEAAKVVERLKEIAGQCE